MQDIIPALNELLENNTFVDLLVLTFFSYAISACFNRALELSWTRRILKLIEIREKLSAIRTPKSSNLINSLDADIDRAYFEKHPLLTKLATFFHCFRFSVLGISYILLIYTVNFPDYSLSYLLSHYKFGFSLFILIDAGIDLFEILKPQLIETIDNLCNKSRIRLKIQEITMRDQVYIANSIFITAQELEQDAKYICIDLVDGPVTRSKLIKADFILESYKSLSKYMDDVMFDVKQSYIAALNVIMHFKKNDIESNLVDKLTIDVEDYYSSISEIDDYVCYALDPLFSFLDKLITEKKDKEYNKIVRLSNCIMNSSADKS